MEYQDATGTPVVSPKSVTGAGSLTLTVPAWANMLSIKGSIAWKYGSGDMDGTAGDGYCNATASAWIDIPVVAGGSFVGKALATCQYEFFFYHEN